MKKIVPFLLLCATIKGMENTVLQGTSLFSPRSQSVDAARHLVGWHPYIHVPNASSWYATISALPEVTRSFKSDRIAQAMFGTDTLHISGSQIENRGEQDILADYFGLSPTYLGTSYINPIITNFIFEFGLFVGFDEWLRGLYLEIFAPAVWTQWSFGITDVVVDDGSDTQFPALYMDENAVTAPVTSFRKALTGNVTFGQMTNPLQYGKVCGAQSKGGLSDLIIILGYDVVSNEFGYASFNARLGAPTGSRPRSVYLFEPIVGNGKHWELGLGFAGRGLVWEKDGQQELNVFVEADFTHYFKAKQQRSFDLCPNGFGSRYELLKQFDENGNYTGNLLPAINVTSLYCNVSVALQFEFLFMFGYAHTKGWVFDIGYNGWIRSKEKINLISCIPENMYGLKGIQNTNTTIGNLSNATQSTASLFGNEYTQQGQTADQNSPVFISTSDISLSSAASPLVLTHKLFTHFGYAWNEGEREPIVPYVGGGLSIEFEGINTSNTVKPNSNTLSQWGFWIKGGVDFS